MKKTVIFAWLLMSAFALSAAELQTITLAVDKMTCNLCPLTVKTALKNVEGVKDATARYEGDGVGWARVTYDPDKVSVEDLTFATEMAGYPSRPKE